MFLRFLSQRKGCLSVAKSSVWGNSRVISEEGGGGGFNYQGAEIEVTPHSLCYISNILV